jgi:hypothetical protein
MNTPNETFISQVVQNKSFADVGGLWGTVNEKVSVAHRNGAASLTMIDVSPLDHSLWKAFHSRMEQLNVPDVQCISANALDLSTRQPKLQFDVLHCAGVLYHLPNPMKLLSSLHAATAEYLILSTSVTATVVENEEGRLEIPSAAALFIPALRSDEQAILRADWAPFVGDHAAGLTQDTRWSPDDFGPWWWLPTIECLKSMCTSTGFRVVNDQSGWNGRTHVLLLAKE